MYQVECTKCFDEGSASGFARHFLGFTYRPELDGGSVVGWFNFQGLAVQNKGLIYCLEYVHVNVIGIGIRTGTSNQLINRF